MRKECAISDAAYQTSRTSSRSPSRYERITALPRARVTVGGLRHSHALRSALVTSVAGLAAVEGTHIAGAARPHHLREYGASVLVHLLGNVRAGKRGHTRGIAAAGAGRPCAGSRKMAEVDELTPRDDLVARPLRSGDRRIRGSCSFVAVSEARALSVRRPRRPEASPMPYDGRSSSRLHRV